jgi:hypothetical protein
MKSGIIRGAGEGSASVSVGYRGSTASATPLPTLYPELEPTYAATLGYEAEKTIRTDIGWTLENVGDVETGGWLLAAEQNPNYILQATVPGSDATATRSSIDLGFEQAEAAQRLHRDFTVAGCWHYHGSGDDVPSDTDLRAFARGARAAGGRWFGLIATPSRSWRPEPEISAWITFGPRSDLLITERLRLMT